MLEDKDGKTAYDIASDNGFTTAMAQINRFAGGNMGKLAPSRGSVNDKITCPNGCGKFIFPYDADEHNEVCPARQVECPNGCGMLRIMFKDLREHVELDCTHMVTTCELCSKAMAKIEIDDHIQNTCDYRLIPCGMCGDNIRACEFRYHIEVCPRKSKPCPLECGEIICQAVELQHVTKECGKRRVDCPLKCNIQVMAENLMNHLKNICMKRPTECSFCGFGLREEERSAHERVCEDRDEMCKCGDMVCIKITKKHLAESCKHRFVDCELHCGRKVREVDMPTHIANDCGNRPVPCPLRCMTVTAYG